MLLSFSNIILIIICFQSVLFACILITHKGPKKISNRLLALFLLCLGIQMGTILVQDTQPSLNFMPWMCVFGFNYGPLIYLYTISLIYQDDRLHLIHLLHFLPSLFLIISTALGGNLCLKSGLFLYISLFTYTILAIREMLLYRKVVKNTRSFVDSIDLKWLQWTIIIFSFALVIDLLDHYFMDIYILSDIPFLYLILLFLVNSMFFKGLKQPQIFLGISKMDQSIVQEIDSELNVPKDQSVDEKVEQDLKKILAYMDTHKPYVQSKLSLQELAESLNLSPRRLSYLINKHLNQTFIGFINSYRIELAKEMLSNPKDSKQTVLEVMYEVGFNSKSSFNTLFKSTTGLTPSEYRKQQS